MTVWDTVEALISDVQPLEFRKVVTTRAGCLQEWALVGDYVVKRYRVVTYRLYENFSRKIGICGWLLKTLKQ